MSDLMGITPARAGRTLFLHFSGSGNRDHPRSRGKDIAAILSEFLIVGSPPLAREGLQWLERILMAIGITPARAGRTF